MDIGSGGTDVELADIGADLRTRVVLVVGLRTNLRSLLYALRLEKLPETPVPSARYSNSPKNLAGDTTQLSRGNNRGRSWTGSRQSRRSCASRRHHSTLVGLCARGRANKRRRVRQKRRVNGGGDGYQRACRRNGVLMIPLEARAWRRMLKNGVGALRPRSRRRSDSATASAAWMTHVGPSEWFPEAVRNSGSDRTKRHPHIRTPYRRTRL